MSESTSGNLLCLRFATRSLWRRRQQFVLLFLTLTTAFWAAYSILGIVSGSLNQLRRDLERIGWDVINVHAPLDPIRFLGHGLTAGECVRFADLVSGVAAPANLQPGMARASAGDGGKPGEAVLLIGTTPAWNEALRPDFLAGRFFRSDESSSCVVDQWAFRRLLPNREIESLGGDETIQLQIAGRWEQFQIAGVVSDPFKIRERFEEWDVTGTARSYLLRFMEYKNIYIPRSRIASGEAILAAVVRVGERIDPLEGARRISEYLGKKGSTAEVWARKEWAQQILDSLAAFSSVSHFIWMVVLVITAFMVVTVVFIIIRGRFPEIAIRRVEGALTRQIALQLILENFMLTILAAGLGLALTQGTSGWMEDQFLGWPVRVSPGDVLLVGLVGAAIILLTTILPARRAASLDPVQVLRER